METVRAYLSPILLAVLALVGLLKDAKDYREMIERAPARAGIRAFARKNLVRSLLAVTLLVSFLGVLDVHSTRADNQIEKTHARVDKEKSDALIASLRGQVEGLRHDNVASTKIFTDSFSVLNVKLADLQGKVRSQELMAQLADTKQELLAVEDKLKPKSKATLVPTFLDPEMKGPLVPQKAAIAKVENGAIAVHLAVVNTSTVDGLNGAIKVILCDACKFLEEPPLCQHLADDSPQERECDFQHIFQGTKNPTMNLKMSVPDNLSRVELGILIVCETCNVTPVEKLLITLAR